MPSPLSPRTPLTTVVRERWLAIVLVTLSVLFVVQNRNRVDFNLFWLHLRMPLWFVLVVMVAVGVVVGAVVARQRR